MPEDDTKKASTSDLAGMGYCSTAKVYTTSLNQLKALEDFDGYKVTYTSFPEASARIMEGDKRREGRRKPDLWRQDPVGIYN